MNEEQQKMLEKLDFNLRQLDDNDQLLVPVALIGRLLHERGEHTLTLDEFCEKFLMFKMQLRGIL